MPIGMVKWFNPESGYGFISQESGGEDVFVHRSGLASGAQLTVGQRVEFRLTSSARGPRATHVTVLPPSTDARPAVTRQARVHELAKELGVTSRQVLSRLSEQGEFVKSASSTVGAPAAQRLRESFGPRAVPTRSDLPTGSKSAPTPRTSTEEYGLGECEICGNDNEAGVTQCEWCETGIPRPKPIDIRIPTESSAPDTTIEELIERISEAFTAGPTAASTAPETVATTTAPGVRNPDHDTGTPSHGPWRSSTTFLVNATIPLGIGIVGAFLALITYGQLVDNATGMTLAEYIAARWWMPGIVVAFQGLLWMWRPQSERDTYVIVGLTSWIGALAAGFAGYVFLFSDGRVQANLSHENWISPAWVGFLSEAIPLTGIAVTTSAFTMKALWACFEYPKGEWWHRMSVLSLILGPALIGFGVLLLLPDLDHVSGVVLTAASWR